MADSTALQSVAEVRSFINSYFCAWQGTDEERILSYYTEGVTVQIPGTLMQGKAALLGQFVRPFITAFPGNRHIVRNMIFGPGVVVVEWTFEAEHQGPFQGLAPTAARVEAPGCGIYEYDAAKWQITSARIYFDVGTLLKHIVDQHPHSSTEEPETLPTGTIAGPVEHLDLATVITVSQTVSGEMDLEKLIDTLLRTAIGHARAQRALLILSRETGPRIAAEATKGSGAVTVRLCDEPVTGSLLPQTVLRYVLQARESVILDDAAQAGPFSADVYIAARQARSVFCLPLTNQAKLIGALYLENNLAAEVFAPARTGVLKLLASQAAISLENSRLYRELAERESKIRRLVDANIIGIFICEIDGRIVEANDAFLKMVGYEREDIIAGRLLWTDMTPPEWRDRDVRQWMPELRARGTLQPFEKEYLRKDGSRVPVLIGVATFEENGSHFVAYVLDLTERKRTQDALNKAGAELARVSRLTALSALTASIAHEVTQPLSGIITNAGTGLRMLDGSPPDIDGARETVRRTLRDGNRAAAVIARLRALFSRREFIFEAVDLNEATREVVALSSSDLQQNRIRLQLELAEALPTVTGDRIQLQQVILNLLRNAADAMLDVEDRPRDLLIRTAEEEGERVRLTIRDRGTGLCADGISSLFDAFYTTKSGGMGIGLFVSRSIIERHRGRLWAEPNVDYPGATFSFSIPRGVSP